MHLAIVQLEVNDLHTKKDRIKNVHRILQNLYDSDPHPDCITPHY
jgi:hypothetical protein